MLFARELLLQYYWRHLIQLDHSFLLAITLSVMLDGRSRQLLCVLNLESLTWLQALSSEWKQGIFHDSLLATRSYGSCSILHSKPPTPSQGKALVRFPELRKMPPIRIEAWGNIIPSITSHMPTMRGRSRNLWEQPIDSSSQGCLHPHMPQLHCPHQAADFP
jgi:hypothetical protein